MSGYLPALTPAYLDQISGSYNATRYNNGVATVVNAIYNGVLVSARTGKNDLTIDLSQYDSTYIADGYVIIQTILTPANGFNYSQPPSSANYYILKMNWP